ncbi:phosphatidylglycerophosphatase C [Dyella jiangningensis]|uniref:HAD family hydrolase n=1 Tax=Dyella sp. AtDHG13 TaxID=1938897 RepID=UPI0008853A0D|nr:HAD family hydrolase [Dyella sp. AtDHG13]PXV59589.1 phosphatidylglycerophosphatase C [Dyella sp. AtDHG13]SDJ31004.1 phosphatidylglycerophosphatase C [Dyella jiangningensis]
MTTGETSLEPAAAETAVAVPRTVLFDFDGVLIHGDAFYLFMRERYRRSWLRKLGALCALPWMLVVSPFSRRLAERALVHVGLIGLNEHRYRSTAEAFGASLVRRPRQFCRDGLNALRRHQAAGDRVIVVTGCEQVLVSHILAQLGLGGIEVLASQLYPGPLGMRVKLHNVGRRKPAQLAAFGVREWHVAYSDSLADAPMLKPAAEAVLVNGTPKLCKKLEKALGRTITRVDWF